MKNVSGVFHDRARVTRAVERLVGESVPTDEITVTVLDARGEPKRDVPVEDESGVLHGVLMGAGVGAALGFVAAILAIGVYVGWSEIWSVVGFSWTVRGALIGMFGGMPLGGVLWMGRWRKKEQLADLGRDGDSVVVEVRSDELAERAHRILDEAGADRVSVREE